MASIQARTRGDGTTAYRVMFRLSGRLVGETFDDPKAAQHFSQLVDRIGGEAARKLRDARDDYTDAVLVKDWLEDHVTRLTGIEDGTRLDYRSMIRRHINPHLGDYPVEAVTRRQIETWVNALTPNMAAKTLRNIQSILSAAMERAVHEELIPSNPVKAVRLPASDHNKTEMVILTPNEFTQLYGSFPERWKPFVANLVGTGERWGEATALMVGACDLEARMPVERIQQAWKRTGKSSRLLGPPKTRKGRRTISLSANLADEIRPLVDDRAADAFVFTGVKGGPIDHAHFYERVWKVALKKADLTKRPRIHDLRHTHATWLLAAGVPLPVVQRRLGHESISTTVDTYGHAMPDDLSSAAEAISDLLSGALPALEVAQDVVEEVHQIGAGQVGP